MLGVTIAPPEAHVTTDEERRRREEEVARWRTRAEAVRRLVEIRDRS